MLFVRKYLSYIQNILTLFVAGYISMLRLKDKDVLPHGGQGDRNTFPGFLYCS